MIYLKCIEKSIKKNIELILKNVYKESLFMINNLNGVNYAKNNIFENNLYQKTVNYFGLSQFF